MERAKQTKRKQPGKPSKKTGDTVSSIRNVFREHGFEGASLSLLTQATGLQRASLYHHFPDGKEGMAIAAIDEVAEYLEKEVFTSLTSDAPWRDRLQTMSQQLEIIYNGGNTLCLFTAFSYGSVPKAVRAKTRRILKRWKQQLSVLIIDAGLSEEKAECIAEQILVEIQGGLVLSVLANDATPFRRVLTRLPTLISDTTNL